MKFKILSIFEEVEKTARVGIRHPFQIAQYDGINNFINFMSYLKDELNGKIDSNEIDITEKIDGFAIRFGCDNNKIFIESSYSGPIFNQGHFTNYAKSKNYSGEGLTIMTGFDKLLKIFQEDEDISSILKKYQPVKLVGECLYTPAGRASGDKLSFVATPYYKNKLGKLATIVLFYSIPSEHFQNMIDELNSLNRNDIKFEDPKINYQFTVNLLPILNNFFNELPKFEKNIQEKYPDLDYDDILNLSLKRKAGVPKEFYINLKSAKAEVTEYFINWGKKIENELSKQIRGKFGDVAEGIVIKLPNGMSIKATSEEFNTSKLEFNKTMKK